MRIGSLKKRITLQSMTRTDDGMGGYNEVPKNEMTVWAAIWSTFSSEALRSGQFNLEITHRLRIRYRPGIKASWRIKNEEKYYSIVSIVDPNMDHRQLDLLCKETETES